MGLKPVIIGIAGVFIMLSLFILMVGALLVMANAFYLYQLVFGTLFALIGFYLLGVGLESDKS